MARTAALWEAWQRKASGTVAAPIGGGSAGVPFMRDTLGPDARLVVEIAWGADPNGDPDAWSWTDITTDVQQADGNRITMRLGRSDAAATTQPAQCSMQLNNRAARYSQGIQSPTYPNVRRNTPIRIRVDPNGTGPVVVWQGYTTSFKPGWDSTGRNAIVALTANGTLRRLIQGASPLASALTRGIPKNPDVVAYWPCEDDKTATAFAAGLTTHGPMRIAGTPDLHSNNDLVASGPLPLVKTSTWSGIVPPHSSTADMLQMAVSWPTSGLVDGTVLWRVFTTGTAARWDVVWHTNGAVASNAYDQNGVQILTGITTVNGLAGSPSIHGLFLGPSGSDTNYQSCNMYQGQLLGGRALGTLAGYTPGVIKSVVIGPNGDLGSLPVGHILVQRNVATPTSFWGNCPNKLEFNAYYGEDPLTRMARLCDENDVPITIVATGEYSTQYQGFNPFGSPATVSQNTLMGHQQQGTLVDLLRQIEATEGGILYDGANAGLTYISRQVRENHAVSMTLDASIGQLAQEFAPVDDDQGNLNKATASRYLGSSATYEDVDGPLGTAAIGIYDSTVNVNNHDDAYLGHYASWAVHKGTQEGYRYPNANVSLEHNPELASAWVAMATDLAARVDVTNIEDVRTQYPAGTISSIVEGASHSVDQFRWDIELNTSPFEVWRIGTIAAETGDTSETLIRLDTDGANLVTTVDAGATSLSVATPSGPLWTTVADNFPFDVDINGRRVTVTSITGASSPQTFTVNAVPDTLAAGASVSLYDPYILGL